MTERPEDVRAEGSEESDGLTRRRFVAGGVVAVGAAVVWASPFPFSDAAIGQLINSASTGPTGPTGPSGHVIDDIKRLRASVEGSSVKKSLRHKLLGQLADAADGVLSHKLTKSCKRMSDFILLVQAHAGDPGLPTGTADDWIQRAKVIKFKLGCPPGPTGTAATG